ncbi:MAG: ROK family protein [Burkholderiaceae bacterium]
MARPSAMMHLGFDLGGTKIEAVALNQAGQVLSRRRLPTPQDPDPDKQVQAIGQTLRALKQVVLKESANAAGGGIARSFTMGLGTPGSVSPASGLLRNSNTTCLNGVLLQSWAERVLEGPVVIENDANCFALAEARQGAGRGFPIVFGVIMGTGCGAGVVINGRIHAGRNRLAGEWGHVSIDPLGPFCWCGQRGCLETFLSGSGLQKAFFDATGLQWSAKQILELTPSKNSPVSAAVVRHVLDLQNRFLWAFGEGLRRVCTILDPDIVVLGGGLSAHPALCQNGPLQVRDQIFGGEFDTPIVVNKLGDSAGVLGAAWLGARKTLDLRGHAHGEREPEYPASG